MSNTRTASGKIGELYAARRLQEMGYTILERNFHSRYGEIDIIATKGDIIAFVEVKTRKKNSWVSPAQAVNIPKQRKILLTAAQYFTQYEMELQPRFDVFCVTTCASSRIAILSEEYIEGAFEANESNRNDRPT